MSGLLGQNFAQVVESVRPFQPTQQGPQFTNPLFNSSVNPYAPSQGFMSPLFMSAGLENTPAPYVQQPSSEAPFRPQLTLQQQLASRKAGTGGK